ncbi:MAG: phage portal protein [Thermoplasmatales archaeon]|nr:MAG: phage portal protein [Thermoplasmatales archaeon]
MIQVQLPDDGLLTTEQIAYIINNTDLDKFQENDNYFTGNNPTILAKDDPDDDHFPNNKTTVPYGRKLSLTTKNYMFNKPVVYTSEDESYLEELQKVFDNNMNMEKVDEIGLDLVVHGASYKLFYFGENGKDIKYSIIKGGEIIPVYDYNIEPNLVCAIRFFTISDFLDSSKDKIVVECYYDTRLVKYETTDSTISQASLIQKDSNIHGFSQVPLVVYGDEWQLGVFDAVKKLIDGVDTITSTNLNEIEAFRLAYLVMTGQKIHEDDVEKIKEKRFFELEPDSTLDYLTKTIDGEFHGSVIDFLVSEIHKQSGVPDFASKDFAAESGIALRYKLMGFENLASSIEYIFKRGEQDSIDIINSVTDNIDDYNRFEYYNTYPDRRIEIKMFRNIPENDSEAVALANQLKLLGVSMEKILDLLPMIENTEEELEKIKEEKEANMEMFNSQMNEPREDENADTDEDNN